MKTNVMTGSMEYTSLKPLDLSNFTKDALNDDSWFNTCPDRLRLPLIFYYGHTSAVYVNKLVLSNLIQPHERINKEFETIYETGVDEMSWDDIENFRMGGAYKWPSVKETHEYRAKVRELIMNVIERTDLHFPVKYDDQLWALFMGFEHDHIHLETSSVLIRQLPIDAVSRPEGWMYGPFRMNESSLNIKNEMIQVQETRVHLGKDYDYPSYGWDNEYGSVDCTVDAFEASKFKITNEEFLEFIESGGYERREWWTDEGWQWCQFRQAKHPSFWICPRGCKSGCGTTLKDYTHCQERHFTQKEIEIFNENKNERSRRDDSSGTSRFRATFPYKFRLMFDVIDMPHNWPVEINYHEAKAFCNWKGKGYRLLSEAEHHAIRDHEEFSLDTRNDIIFQERNDVNHNMVFGSSTPVNYYPSNSKGFHDVFGNVWEWCEDHFNGLPGFKTTYIYDDFSIPCFDGRHNIIMGGSWISTGDEASRFARYMFRRHFLQHCGFRLARSLPSSSISQVIPNPQIRLVDESVYILGQGFTENPLALDPKNVVLNRYQTENKQYLFDSNTLTLDAEIKKNYAHNESKWLFNLLDKCKDLLNTNGSSSHESLLHIGASTGRLSFELSKYFDKIVSLDFCGQFIDFCQKLQSTRKFEQDTLKFELNGNKNADRIQFLQMSWLPNEIPSSDFVLFTNIDVVQNARSWLRRFRELVNKNGTLAIYSQDSKWTCTQIDYLIHTEFQLLNEFQLDNATLTVWKYK